MILPTDATILTRLASAPIPIGSRSLTVRQRTLFIRENWVYIALHNFGGYQTRHYHLSEHGRLALIAYNELTLGDTFK